MTDIARQTPAASGFSRRDFLRGSGAAAAATALAAGPGLAAEPESGTRVLGPQMQPITLHVNGQDHTVTVEPRTTLLEVLRYQLNLTGAKPISGHGASGGSTVFVDDKPFSASTTLALTCVGKKVRTVESLGGERPDAVPVAFLHNDGLQCGFCTPGFVVAVRAFLDKHPQATEADVRAGLNGNICRCGTYANVIMAALEAVKGGARG
jgi:aerobic-type carbon monoxide dehydrogenase small subunit (CoxS/CutS family)